MPTPVLTSRCHDPSVRERALRILDQEISFIHSAEFHTLTDAQIESAVPDDMFQPNSGGESSESRIGGSLVGETRLLTAEGENYLFKRMNFLKYKAASLRARLRRDRPSFRMVEEIERLLKEAAAARSTLVEANLRLVFSIAHKFASGTHEADEFVGEGNVILVNAVDRFDYSRGYRFSTYATHAVQRHYFRLMQRRKKRNGRELAAPNDVLGAMLPDREHEAPLDYRIAEVLIGHFPDCLDDRERTIIEERFGLTNSESGTDTLKAVADKVGLSKERVRQLQIRAIEKLQDLAIHLGLRLEPHL